MHYRKLLHSGLYLLQTISVSELRTLQTVSVSELKTLQTVSVSELRQPVLHTGTKH